MNLADEADEVLQAAAQALDAPRHHKIELAAGGVFEQAVESRAPAGKALFQMMGVFAEFERSMIVARVRAGMARAK
jgi:hypothetical protein